MSDNDLFRDLVPFEHFVDEAFESRFYVPLPLDWLVLVADVVCSTDAVNSGKYEAVNYVGAGCVVALTNAIPDLVIPTVFGGDGASAAVPGNRREEAEVTLLAMRRWARSSFDLDLRVGIVPMSEIAERGGHLEIGKMQLGPANEIAMFRGSGLDLADDLVKNDTENRYQIDEVRVDAIAIKQPDLTDLSCRWSPINPDNGLMLCMIIGVRNALGRKQSELDELTSSVVSQINAIVALEDPDTSPVKIRNLDFKLRVASIMKEVKSRPGNLFQRVTGVLFINFLAKVLFRFQLKAGSFDPDVYKQQVVLNSDFMKVNGMVRIVLDCTSDQADRIEALLSRLFDDGDIVFGLHRASQALMTCVTPDIENGKHLHYIDATEGGFWTAATDLKRRISLAP